MEQGEGKEETEEDEEEEEGRDTGWRLTRRHKG